jgi:hypothetical protein
MIHSLSGGIIADYEKLIYAFVDCGGQKMWYISPFPKISVGDKVNVPTSFGQLAVGEVVRLEVVTKQTAPYPVNRTKEIDSILQI